MNIDMMTRQGRSFSGNERNCCFLNTGGFGGHPGQFANISAASGIDLPDDGRALAMVDWDHDGDLDIWVSNRNAPRVRFFLNEMVQTNNWIQLKLVGNGKNTNRNAIGARVIVELDEKDANGVPVKLIKTVRAGEGFLSQSSRWLHFGLGKNGKATKITVHWPNAENSSISVNGSWANIRKTIVQDAPFELSRPLEKRTIALTRSTVQPLPKQAKERIGVVPVPIEKRVILTRNGFVLYELDYQI